MSYREERELCYCGKAHVQPGYYMCMECETANAIEMGEPVPVEPYLMPATGFAKLIGDLTTPTTTRSWNN